MLQIARRSALTLLVFLSLASVAHAQGVEIFSGQKISAEFEDEGGFQDFRFEAIAGDSLTLSVIASKKGGFVPRVSLLGPAGEVALPAVTKGKLKAKKVPLASTGSYQIVISGGGTTGPYSLALKLKSAKVAPATVPVPGPYVFDALRGATVTATIKAAKGTGLEPGVDSVIDPTAADILVPSALTEKRSTAKIKKLVLSASGTHRMNLAVRAGGAGNAVVKLKVKTPKPAAKKLRPGDLVDCGVLKARHGAESFGFLAWAEGEKVQKAALVKPDGSEVPLENGGGEFSLDRGFGTEAALDAAFPDGLYGIRVTRVGGGVREIPMAIGGAYPGPVVITDPGAGATPTVEWTGGAGAQVLYVGVRDPIAEEEIFSTLLPGTETSFAIPAEVLEGLPAHQVDIWAITGGRKVSASSAESGGGDLEVTHSQGGLYRVAVEASGGSSRRYTQFLALLEGSGIRSVELRFPATAGRPDEPLTYDDGRWIYEEYASGPGGFPDGVYGFVVTPFDGAPDLSHTFGVGGVMPDNVGSFWPRMGWIDFGTTEQIWWDIPPDGALNGYHLQIKDDSGAVVVDRGFRWDEVTYDPPAGLLEPNRWFSVTLTRDNGVGKISLARSAFYTGSGKNLWLGIEKVRDRRGNSGAVAWFFECEVESSEVASATLLDPWENEYTLAKVENDVFLLEREFATEAALDAAFADGLYSIELTMKNGATTDHLEFFVGGPWPAFADMISPADGATAVSRTPTVTWRHNDLTNVSGAGIGLWNEAKDDDYAWGYPPSTDTTSVAWAEFNWKAVDELPKNATIDVELETRNGQGKLSLTLTSFKTGP